jgi:hypothetical protein
MYPTTVDTVTAGGGDGSSSNSSSSSFIQYVFGSMSFTIGRIMVSWVATWMFRVGSVTIGLVIIAGSILYIKQDNLLVRLCDPIYIYIHLYIYPSEFNTFVMMVVKSHFSLSYTITIVDVHIEWNNSTFQKSVVYHAVQKIIHVGIVVPKNDNYHMNHI